jgi:iron complex outermembrane receptor protein
MRKSVLAGAVCLLSYAAAAAADEADGDAVPQSLGVIEVIGSADKTLPPGADVLDIDTIKLQDRRNVAEALDLLPGVARQNVGQRRDTLVNIRGFDSREVTLYVDGVPVYVPYDGNLDLARLGVEDLSQIIVTKGLTSVLYGPNALGGSINLVSRRPQEALEGRVYAGFDMDRSGDVPAYRAGGRIGTNQGDWYAQATASWQDADYYELPSGYPHSTNQPGDRRANSASRDLNLSAKFGWTPNATDEYALGLYHVDDEKQTPPYAGHAPGVAARFWRWPYWDKDGVYLITRTRVTDSADLRVRAYYDTFQNELDSYDNANYDTITRPYAFKSNYDDHTYGVSADFEQRWSESQITRLALHAKQDFHRETDAAGSPPESFKDRTFSAGLEHEWHPAAAWTVTPGVSWNLLQAQRADNLIGNGVIVPFAVGSDVAFNSQIVAAFQATDTMQIYAGASRKTRFPTLKDRYSYRLGTAIPNPELKPEDSNNLEVGIKDSVGAFHYQAALFDSHLQDAIQAVTLAPTACTSPPCSQNQNVGRAINRGVELSAGYVFGPKLSIDASYTNLDRVNQSQPSIKFTDTPRQKFFTTIDYAFVEGWSAILNSDTESKRYSSSDGSRIAGSFTLIDARVRGRLPQGFDLSVGIRNAFDRRYEYQEGFPEPGRTFFAEVGKSF